ncbi:hypothetical protein [Lachnospira multipara]|uniref:hypothetical protein n=1 Tax=Lachnospira multipara TaxID=28051 RepID=UPI0004E1FD81|nr:hypothetical protein [Lachnospira multipara]
MKIKMKRLFGIMLSLVLVLGLMPVTSLTTYAEGEGESESGTGTGTGTYSATLEADLAVNSNNLSLEIRFFDNGGGTGNELGEQPVTISPETGTYNGDIPKGTKSVKLKVETDGNLVDFNSSSITISGNKVNDIGGITGSLPLDINETNTLNIYIKVISNNQGGENPGPGPGDPSQGGGSQERITLSFTLSGDVDIIAEISVFDGTETQRLNIQDNKGTVTVNEADKYTITISPEFGGFKIASASIDGNDCAINGEGIASREVSKKNGAYNISVTKGEQSDDVTILWTYDPKERTGGWSDAYIDASTGTVEYVGATRGGSKVDLVVDKNNGGYIQCKKGDVVTLKFVPKAGYQLTSASLNGQTLVAQASQSTFTVTMNGNFHLAGAFSKTNPQVKVSGSSSVSGLSVSGTDAALNTGNVAVGVTGGKSNPDDDTIQTAMGNDSDDFVSAVETVDITMTNVISKGGSGDYFSNASNYWTNNMTDLSSAASFSLSVPNNLSEGETYSIVRNHNGTLEELDAIYNSTMGRLTFSSDKFSNYTIIKKKGTPITNQNDNSSGGSLDSTDTSTKVPYADVATTAGAVNDITDTDAVTSESNPFGAKIENNDNLTTLLALTPEEVAQGVNVWLDIQDMSDSVQETDKTLIQDTSGDFTVGLYFDINLFKKVGGNDATKVTETNGKVQASIVIPESLRKSGRTFEIIRVHEGEATDITGTYDENTHVFTFETDKFSTYALAYKDQASLSDSSTTSDSGSSDSSNSTQSTAPETGDPNDIRVWYLLLLASIGGLGFLGGSKKKKVND